MVTFYQSVTSLYLCGPQQHLACAAHVAVQITTEADPLLRITMGVQMASRGMRVPPLPIIKKIWGSRKSQKFIFSGLETDSIESGVFDLLG